MKHAVFIFCIAPEKDPAPGNVLHALKAECTLQAGVEVNGHPVLEVRGLRDATISIVMTNEVVSNNYARYSPTLNDRFGGANPICIVNWHEGANAPNAIFTVQTTGDLASGTFSPVDPRITRGLFLAIEGQRIASGLNDFQTYLEATLWSGVKTGDPGTRLADLSPSANGIEIGSSPADCTNALATRVLARALLHIFDHMEEPVQSVLCTGGVHLKPSFTSAVLRPSEGLPIAASHILPNHWLVSDDYDRQSRLVDLRACAHSIVGGIQGIVYHDKLKAPYKGVARLLAEELRVPMISHKKCVRLSQTTRSHN